MLEKTFFVLKVKGKAKIPDYIQVRDEDFTLVGYFRPGREQRGSRPTEQSTLFTQIEAMVTDIPEGVVTKVSIEV